MHLFVSPQDTLVAIRVTLPEKDEDTDEPSPAESLQMSVSSLAHDIRLHMTICSIQIKLVITSKFALSALARSTHGT